jgi:hypothetical protein
MKSRNARASILLLALTSGCGINGSNTAPELDMLGFEYAMPFVSYKIQVEVPLEKCNAGNNKNEAAFGKLTVVAVPDITADRTVYRLRLSALESDTVDNNLTVAKYDNGTIKSINAVADDRTVSIVGNLFKFIAGLFKSAQPAAQWVAKDPEDGVLACNDTTRKLFEEAELLKKANYEELRKIADTDLKTGDPQAFSFHSANVEKLIALRGQRLAAIKETLTRKGECTLAPSRDATSARCEIELKTKELVSHENLKLMIDVARAAKPVDKAAEDTKLVFRNMKRENICVSTPEEGGWTVNLQERDLPYLIFPQWGDDIALPLDVGVSQKRTIALTFSPLGEISTINWATPARFEKATADLAGTAEAALGVKTAVKYGEDDAEIADLDRKIALLEKRAKLEELKAKQAASELPSQIPDADTPTPDP